MRKIYPQAFHQQTLPLEQPLQAIKQFKFKRLNYLSTVFYDYIIISFSYLITLKP